MHQSPRPLIVTILIAALAPAAAAPADDEQAPQPDPRQVSLADVLPALRQEVWQSWQHHDRWPRNAPDFAAQRNWTLPHEQVIRALTWRLDPNPAIDAYMKWQLLGFGPDLADLDDETLRRMLAVAPPPLAQPEPRILRGIESADNRMTFGPQVSHAARLSPLRHNGVLTYRLDRPARDAHGRSHVAREANLTMRDARDAIERANRPIRAYRDLLIAHLPAEGGVRLAAGLRDVSDRLEAGDTTAELVMRKLTDDAQYLADDPTLDPQFAQRLISRAQWLGERTTRIVRTVTLDERGRLVRDYQPLSLPHFDIDLLIRHLEDAVTTEPL